eukprot:39213_1
MSKSDSSLNNVLLDGVDIISKLQSVINENKIKLDAQLERKLKSFIEQTANISSKTDDDDRKTAPQSPLLVPTKPGSKLKPNLSKAKSMNALVRDRNDAKSAKPSFQPQTPDAFAAVVTAAVIKINETLKPIDLSSVQRLFGDEKEFNESTITDIDPDLFCERAKQYNITTSQAKRILNQLQCMDQPEFPTTATLTRSIAKESPAPRTASLKVQPRFLKSKSLNALQGLDGRPKPLWKKEKWLRDKDKLDGIMDLSKSAKPREKAVAAVPPLFRAKSMNALQDREDATSNTKQLDKLQQTIKRLKKQLEQGDAHDGVVSNIDVQAGDEDHKEKMTITITPAVEDKDTMDPNDSEAEKEQGEKPKHVAITLKQIVSEYMSLFERIHGKAADANTRQDKLRSGLLEAASMKSLDDCVDDDEAQMLMKEKIELCEYICDFNRTEDESEALCIENKTDVLTNILQYMSGHNWGNMQLFEQCLETIKHNLFRPLPADHPFDDVYDPAWAHIQLMYELTYHVSGNVSIEKKTMQTYFDAVFLRQLINLFCSPDDREPEYVKIIVHQIYSRFMKLRPPIRKGLGEYCYPYIYLSTYRDDALWQGVPQILEIFGSVFQGLNVPVKSDYHDIMRNVIIPLHKSFHLDEFHGELVICCIYFLDKEPSAAPSILGGILKFWPKQNPLKEQLFMSEIIDILKVCADHPNMDQSEPEFVDVTVALLKKLIECMGARHHEVAEKAMMVWNDQTIRLFVDMHKDKIAQELKQRLEDNEENHWSEDVKNLTDVHLRIIRTEEDEAEFALADKEEEQTEPVEQEKKRRKRNQNDDSD